MPLNLLLQWTIVMSGSRRGEGALVKLSVMDLISTAPPSQTPAGGPALSRS